MEQSSVSCNSLESFSFSLPFLLRFYPFLPSLTSYLFFLLPSSPSLLLSLFLSSSLPPSLSPLPPHFLTHFLTFLSSPPTSLPSLPLLPPTLPDGINTVASSSPLGHIAIWDLDNRRLGAVIRDAHNGSAPGLYFLQSQPLLLTSGPDNSLKMWIFDQSDGSARLLRSRCGHSAPPTKIRFYTKGGLGLLSAGGDAITQEIAAALSTASTATISLCRFGQFFKNICS